MAATGFSKGEYATDQHGVEEDEEDGPSLLVRVVSRYPESCLGILFS
jgi:hypothetical protein